ncbi:MAG: hypothetical protein R2824_02045 [Saprospiraceae bacterium]
MSLSHQFEQKLFSVLGHALDDPSFADELITDPDGAIKRKGLFLSGADLKAAQQFVKEMLVAREEGQEPMLNSLVLFLHLVESVPET